MKRKTNIIVLIILIVFVLLHEATNAFTDYDVDMPPSNDPAYQVVRIGIDGCDTIFPIKKEDFDKVTKDDKAMDDMVDIAIKRSKSGCRGK